MPCFVSCQHHPDSAAKRLNHQVVARGNPICLKFDAQPMVGQILNPLVAAAVTQPVPLHKHKVCVQKTSKSEYPNPKTNSPSVSSGKYRDHLLKHSTHCQVSICLYLIHFKLQTEIASRSEPQQKPRKRTSLEPLTAAQHAWLLTSDRTASMESLGRPSQPDWS